MLYKDKEFVVAYDFNISIVEKFTHIERGGNSMKRCQKPNLPNLFKNDPEWILFCMFCKDFDSYVKSALNTLLERKS